MAAPQKHPADEMAAALARINGMLTMMSGVYDPNTGTFVTGVPFVHESVQAMEVLVARATEALTVLYQTCDLTIMREIAPRKAPAVAKDPVQEEVRPAAPSKLDQAAQAFEEASKFAASAKALVSSPEEVRSVMSYTPAAPQASLQGPGENQEGMPARAAAPPPAPAFAPAKPETGYMYAFGPAPQPEPLTQRVEKTLAPTPVAPPAPKPVVNEAVVAEKRAESYEELLRKITMVSSQAHAEGKAASVDGALLPLVDSIRQDLAKMRSVA